MVIDDVRWCDLTLSVQFVVEPALWCWEIHETASRRFVESSWSSSWMAYGSPEEAREAGSRRLAEVTTRAERRVA